VRVCSAQRPGEQHIRESVIIRVECAPGDFCDGLLAWQRVPDNLEVFGIGLGHVRRDRRFTPLHGCRRLDSPDHAGVTRTAAVGVLEGAFDILLAGMIVAVEQSPCGEDQARRTESALHRTMIDKRLLQGIEQTAFFQPFNGRYVPSFGPQRRVNAGVNRHAVDQDGAGAAFGLVAADFRAC
jgi:hypothetical protein